MTFVRISAALLLVSCGAALRAQEFEVTSIRPSKELVTPTPLCGNITQRPESVLSSESLLSSAVFRLDDLVRLAYRNDVDDFDLPPWMRNDGTFAISVKIPANITVRACRMMLQNLLGERFHLVTGVETREVPRYYLNIAKTGLKLKPVSGPPAELGASARSSIENNLTRTTFRSAPMAQIVNILDGAASRYAFAFEYRFAGIVDETGLTGPYDGEFAFTSSIAALRDGGVESIEDAVTRQLGLTLELRKAPGRVLVIRSSDHTPTEN